MSKERKDNIIHLFNEAKKGKTSKIKKEKNQKSIIQKVSGNNNITIGVARDIKITTTRDKKPVFKIMPPLNSIGADPLLKKRIQDIFNKLADARVKRLGETQEKIRKVMYSKFKRDFGIKGSYSEIWGWPESTADEIINYWESKWYKTIPGRVERAAQKEDYMHSRKYLYELEVNYLNQLNLKIKSNIVKNFLIKYFGKKSHSQLTHLEHFLWVKRLETILRNLEKKL